MTAEEKALSLGLGHSVAGAALCFGKDRETSGTWFSSTGLSRSSGLSGFQSRGIRAFKELTDSEENKNVKHKP